MNLPRVSILLIVDSVASLADRNLKGHLFAFDDGFPRGSGMGTDHLETRVYPGQQIAWKIVPVDLQTPAAISSISFGQLVAREVDGMPEGSSMAENPDVFDWTGIVPDSIIPGASYRYTVEVLIGHGENSLHKSSEFALIYQPY